MTIVKKINMDTSGMFFNNEHFPIVHNSMVPNLKSDFYGTDNKEDFEINLSRLPHDWYYRTNKISYQFNNVGLRMNKDLDQVSNDYIAGFGCSHTVGVGVNISDTWIHTLSQELNLDYINAGVSGGSIKLCAINFFNMLNTDKPLPKIAVFAWPSSIRYCFYENNEFVFYLPRFISNEKKFTQHNSVYKEMITSDILTNEALLYRSMVKSTCNRLGIKYAEFTFDGHDGLISHGLKAAYVDPNIKTLNLDHGRDIRDKTGGGKFSHPGVRIHKLAKDIVVSQL